MADMFVLKEYYIKYLREVRGVKESTVKHYLDAISYISKYLVEQKKIETSVYEIAEIGELEIIRKFLSQDNQFRELDKRGHQMYSAGLNNYYKFASGEVFVNNQNGIKLLDTPLPIKDIRQVEKSTYSRSSIIKTQAIQSASYTCEISGKHKTFVSKSTGNQYMEGHHAIPLKVQKEFNSSLDIYANVVCLCPICHRLLHYGMDSEKEKLIGKIYYDRADRLANSGIILSQNEFKEFAM